MKILIITAILFSVFTISINAQQHSEHTESAKTTQQSNQLSQVFSLYLDIKNALVSDNATLASSKADAFTKAVNAVDMNELSSSDMNAFMTAQKKLAAEAGQVAETKDIKKQREAFTLLSSDMITLAKSAKLSEKPVYVDYCTMKKISWLSNNATIKNPYFGRQMSTCGKVTETIQ